MNSAQTAQKLFTCTNLISTLLRARGKRNVDATARKLVQRMQDWSGRDGTSTANCSPSGQR